MKLRIFALMASLILLLTACTSIRTASEGKQKAHELKTKEHIVIAAVGDSLTEGVGDPEGKGYVGKVADSIRSNEQVKKVDVKNYAVKGNRTEDLLEKLKDKNVQKGIKDADYVFLTIGGNDLMKVLRQNFLQLTVEPFQEEEKPYEKRFKKIISEIRALNNHAELIYVSMYNPFTFTLSELQEINGVVTDWNNIAKKELKKDKHAKIINIEDLFNQKSDSKRISEEDDFHPNGTGYSLIAKRVYQAIEKEGLPKE
ncbi:SGNH/GDSL hydrolase family protein [Bacillus mojavensis]|uniref:SGNH/GDSL hydrolase family protein n=1 Tax=Bacillus mojavensis TaxID=72360 RepID=UPI002DBEBF05|nr:SGNH/GDSL hydrolase family protein [Bacillus mojavensis]MEC1614610.1 SGNH/GDSL hydrolase family protein [Bacillus mojavensis]MEC1684568.1 SGNH/GDSL hydrolase family protein [Bacillus mojavensis]MEC1691039.1 SGNH/GDSL hydrolase family protein [Bacillus mojavensis]MEC1706591.1 SGNH/GDSL hydrolase family protein [Bacillus mojavensis]